MAPAFDCGFAISTVVPLCEAAYDLNNLPADWKLVARIEPLDYGFIAQRDSELAIVFRGTEGSKPDAEWFADFDAAPVQNYYGTGTVHRGFQDVYSRIRECVATAYAGQHCESLLISGHSLGAALAVLCAGDLARAGAKPRVYTLAGPRPGWHSFSQWFDGLVPDCFRIVNRWDIVPHLPSSICGAEHVGHGVLVDGGYTLDWHTAHSLPLSYLPGLKRWTEAATAKVA